MSSWQRPQMPRKLLQNPNVQLLEEWLALIQGLTLKPRLSLLLRECCIISFSVHAIVS